VGKDVNEYIEIHQSAGQLLGMRDFTEIHFFDYPIGNVPYKVVNISQMTLCTTSNISEKFYGYKFPLNEDFADSGRVVLLATGWRTDTIAVYTYNSAGIKMEDKYQSSPFTKFFSAYEDNSTPIGYSLNFCGGYLDSNWQPSIIIATLDTVNACIKQYLPVQLYNFTAVSKQNEVLLSWQTTTEENNNHFDLERSEDGKLFKSIGKIKAITQKIATKSYTFIDKNPNYLNHYRLKQVDNDGKYSYSPLLFVKQENAIPFSILYNYSENQHLKLQISRLSVKGNFVMHNFIGKKILELEAKMGTQFLDVSKLVAGTYLLTLYMENGAAFTKTFIKK
jgi:hypothetical protein